MTAGSNPVLTTMSKASQRESAKAQGFYDGRFRSKIVRDAKKHANKTACKIKTKNDID
jgi:hypothetical protein